MKGTFRLVKVFGIDIDLHITFLLLLGLFFMFLGFKGFFLILGVFLLVTIHEMCHSLVAAHYGIKVKHITLLPIGGVAAMNEVPTKPFQELFIAIAGPLSNVIIAVVFFFPLMGLLGRESFFYPLAVMTGHAKYTGQFHLLAHIYWINIVLAAFNMIPAFPMDGGRVLRSVLSYRMGYKKGTEIAVKLGHIFALLFAYLGIANGHMMLVFIAVFIYMAASSEGHQVEVTETIKNYRIADILPGDFTAINAETRISEVLDLMFRDHQENYPVLSGRNLEGLVTRKEILKGIHEIGKSGEVSDIMRRDLPTVNMMDRLHVVRKTMHKFNTDALPVEKNGQIIGVVSADDITRLFVLQNER